MSRILGHASTQTTRIYYAKPSLEIIKQAMDKSNPELNAAEQLWPSLFRVRPAGWFIIPGVLPADFILQFKEPVDIHDPLDRCLRVVELLSLGDRVDQISAYMGPAGSPVLHSVLCCSHWTRRTSDIQGTLPGIPSHCPRPALTNTCR